MSGVESADPVVNTTPMEPQPNELHHLQLVKHHLALASKLKGKNTILEDDMEEYGYLKSDLRTRFQGYLGVCMHCPSGTQEAGSGGGAVQRQIYR